VSLAPRLRRRLLGALLCLAALGVAPASASVLAGPPRLAVGIADQKPGMFADPLFAGLGLRHARLVVPWDALNVPYQRAQLDTWLRTARAAGVDPLLTFGHSRRPGHEKLRPSPATLQRQLRRLRLRYPWVTEFATWNEPNHCGEPLCHKPELAARYYDALRRTCPHCTILAAEVLDQPNMVAWVKAFRRAAKVEPRYWGIHNYLDANRLRTSGTRALLKATHGEVWFTETGGIVKRTTVRKVAFTESAAHAALATRWVFDRLAPLSPRIRRVYLYHWDPAGPHDKWDSALVAANGTPRPAFRVLRNRVLALEGRPVPGARTDGS
jgi:hypothetical protein